MLGITIDVDNVVANSMEQFCKLATRKLGYEVSLNLIKNHKVVGSLPITPAEIFRLQTAVWNDWENVELVEEISPKIIEELHRLGYKVRIASSAPYRNIIHIRKWLEFRNIYYDDFFASRNFGRRTWKASNNTNILIDDDPEEIIESSNYKALGLIFDRPWNRMEELSNIKRIYSLSDIFDIIS